MRIDRISTLFISIYSGKIGLVMQIDVTFGSSNGDLRNPATLLSLGKKITDLCDCFEPRERGLMAAPDLYRIEAETNSTRLVDSAIAENACNRQYSTNPVQLRSEFA